MSAPPSINKITHQHSLNLIITRRERDEPFDKTAAQILTHLQPHIAQAFRVHQRLARYGSSIGTKSRSASACSIQACTAGSAQTRRT